MGAALAVGCSKSATGPAATIRSITVAPASATLSPGQTVHLAATATDSNGDPVSGASIAWTTSDATVAAVAGDGTVTGVGAGAATISATSGQARGTSQITVSGGGGGGINHAVLVILENKDYAKVIGSSLWPYLNGLAQQYGLATQYYADTHPSIGNYFTLTVGDTITNNDEYAGTVASDNVVRELAAAHKTWKSYAEDMPSAGFLGNTSQNYARYHNSPTFFTDVRNDSTQVKNLVPFAQFAGDLANGALPNFSLIIPNLCDDAHSCAANVADSWLKTNIDPLINNAAFRRDGLVIITFDESDVTAVQGGGQVAWIVAGAKAKRGYKSSTLYQHESTLRFILKSLGVTHYPNRAASAADMDEFLAP